MVPLSPLPAQGSSPSLLPSALGDALKQRGSRSGSAVGVGGLAPTPARPGQPRVPWGGCRPGCSPPGPFHSAGGPVRGWGSPAASGSPRLRLAWADLGGHPCGEHRLCAHRGRGRAGSGPGDAPDRDAPYRGMPRAGAVPARSRRLL